MDVLQEGLWAEIQGGQALPPTLQALEKAMGLYMLGAQVIHHHQAALLQATAQYAHLGRIISETVFHLTHPEPLGKMVYYSDDFIK